MTRKLGRVASRQDPRTLRLGRYIDTRYLPAAPPARDWTHPATAPAWGMWGNDRLGDCTCASRAHILQAEAANTGKPIAITDDDVIATYRVAGGYDPARPETDQGAQMLDVLVQLRDVGMAGQRIGAFVSVEPQNRCHVEAAINMFCSLWIGLDLPLAWQDATVWDVAPVGESLTKYRRNSWGGHAVAVLAYSRTGLVCVTWGALKHLTWEALWGYCSEAYTTVDELWIGDSGLAPSGFNSELLRADLAAIEAAP